MKRNKFVLFLGLFLFFGIQSSLAQYITELEEVIVYSSCHPLSDEYDPCYCDNDCPDSYDCTDPDSVTYPCDDDIDDSNDDIDDSNDDGGGDDPCDEIEELNAEKEELEKELEELNEKAFIKQDYVDRTEDLTLNGAVADIVQEYIEAFMDFTPDQIEAIINDPDALETNVLTLVSQLIIDIGIGDYEISDETRNQTQEEAAQEILNAMSGLSSRGIALVNILIPQVRAATKKMHQIAKLSQTLNNAEIFAAKNKLSKVEARLEELSNEEC
jgi:hypothetical protein